MPRRRDRLAAPSYVDMVLGGLFGLIVLFALGAFSLWSLFIWQPSNDASGGIWAVVRDFYRPVMVLILFVDAALILVPLGLWLRRRVG